MKKLNIVVLTLKHYRKPAKLPGMSAVILMMLMATAVYAQYKKAGTTAVLGPLDQATAKQVTALDKQNKNATFVFVNQVPGAAAIHNKVIMLPPVSNDLRIDLTQYVHKGHSGPLYIILPNNYAGPKEKFILKSFPDYKGWYGSMLSDNFVMYAAK